MNVQREIFVTESIAETSDELRSGATCIGEFRFLLIVTVFVDNNTSLVVA